MKIKPTFKTLIQICLLGALLLALPAVVQAQFTFTTNNGAITITGYNTAAGLNAVIPAATNGWPVTGIGDDAFEFKGITDVTIPNSVTSIGDYAFDNCSSLKNVTIPNSVTSLGTVVFRYCTSLTSVTIPNSVPSIGNGAFLGCISLTSVTIPNSVISIGDEAFYNCSSVTNVTIGNGVTNIGIYAFDVCASLTSVTIGNSVTSIGDYAFYDCTNLKSAYFQGNAPPDDGTVFTGNPANDPATVYYLPGTTGWSATFGGVPTVLWNPQTHALRFTGGHFGFNLNGPTNAVIVLEACTNLAHAVWLPVATNTFSGSGTSTFSDLQSGAHPTRFYRERSP